MAGGNSPRQKMINLMYLVFISMLALNIGVEVLNAFGVINERFEESNNKSRQINESAIEALKLKATEEPDKYSAPYEKAEQVREVSNELYNYIGELKADLMSKVAESDKSNYAVMDKSDNLDQRFFGTDGKTPEGEEFVNKLESYKNKVIEILGKDNSLSDRVRARFNIDPVKDSEGKERDWLEYSFKGYPLIASVTRFSQIQNDVVSTEEEVFSDMLAGQMKSDISMKNYTTLLEQPRSAFYQGDQFDGSIVLGRKDNSTKPSEVELFLDGRKLAGSEYEVKDGKVQLKVGAGSAGDHKITGNLYFDQDGDRITVPVDQSFITIPKPNSAVVSADKMNVVYRAIANPITISMPGVPDNKISASAPGLRKVGGTKYLLTPGSGNTVKINVTGEIDGQKFSSSQVFRIKDIPRPAGGLGGGTGDLKRSKSYVSNASVSAVMEDFDFDLNLQVKSFMISVPGQPSLLVNGSRMDSKAQSLIARAKRGDVIQIFDIKSVIVGNSGYRVKPTSPVSVEITN